MVGCFRDSLVFMDVGLFLRKRSKLKSGGHMRKAKTLTECVQRRFGFDVGTVEVSGRYPAVRLTNPPKSVLVFNFVNETYG
jgi:hypothetical protein